MSHSITGHKAVSEKVADSQYVRREVVIYSDGTCFRLHVIVSASGLRSASTEFWLDEDEARAVCVEIARRLGLSVGDQPAPVADPALDAARDPATDAAAYSKGPA